MKKTKSVPLSEDYSFAYSTKSGFNPFEALSDMMNEQSSEQETNAIAELHYEVKGRNGNPVTIIKNLPEHVELEALASELKKFLNTGGSVKDAQIILQGGDKRKEIANWLMQKGIKTKRVGGLK